jgi:DNA-3-methyladenine glycosylase
MYARGGILYVYLCLGIHHLSNIVTNQEGSPMPSYCVPSCQPKVDELILNEQEKDKITLDILEGPEKYQRTRNFNRHEWINYRL